MKLTQAPPPPRTALEELTSLGRAAMKEIHAVRRAPLWVGSIEGIFGYGFIVVADSEAECDKALRKEYKYWRKQRGLDQFEHFDSYSRAFEYFGGCISKIQKGKVYNDGFRE